MLKDERNKLDTSRALLFPIFLILTLIGVSSTFILNLENGKVYFIILVIAIVSLYITYFFLPKDTNIIEYAFSKSLLQSIFFFFLGVLIIPVLNILLIISGVAARSYTIIKPFAVFSTAGSLTGTTFKVIQLQLDKFWSFFFTVWTAGVMETFIFNFAAVVVGTLIGHFILQLSPNMVKKEEHKRIFRAGVALLFSGVLFSAAHTLNETYDSINMFLINFIFLLLLNIILYYFNFVIMFVVGIHMSNNFFANLSENVAGALTLKGMLLNSFLLVLLIYLVVNYKKIPDMFKGYKASW